MAKMSMGRSPMAMNQQAPRPPTGQQSPTKGYSQGLAQVLGAKNGLPPGLDALIASMLSNPGAMGKAM